MRSLPTCPTPAKPVSLQLSESSVCARSGTFFDGLAAFMCCSSCQHMHKQLDSVASSVHDIYSCGFKLSMTACCVHHTMRCWQQACCQSLQRAWPIPLGISVGSRGSAVSANANYHICVPPFLQPGWCQLIRLEEENMGIAFNGFI